MGAKNGPVLLGSIRDIDKLGQGAGTPYSDRAPRTAGLGHGLVDLSSLI